MAGGPIAHLDGQWWPPAYFGFTPGEVTAFPMFSLIKSFGVRPDRSAGIDLVRIGREARWPRGRSPWESCQGADRRGKVATG